MRMGTGMSESTAISDPSLSIPTVTRDDLYGFYLQHFSSHPSAAFCSRYLPSLQVPPSESTPLHIPTEDDDDDGLGYYADGVKRTLTDEQIAIFRHSEIQTLLREQRRHAAAQADVTDHEEVNEVISSSGSQAEGERMAMDDDEDEREYIEFLKRERREFHQAEGAEDVSLAYDDEAGPAEEVRTNDEISAWKSRKSIVYEDAEDGSEVLVNNPAATFTRKKEFYWPKIGG